MIEDSNGEEFVIKALLNHYPEGTNDHGEYKLKKVTHWINLV